MMRYNPVYQLSLAKVRTLLREPEAIFWVFVFPVLLALALGVAFRSRGVEELPVGVQTGDGAPWIVEVLDQASEIRVRTLEPGESYDALRKGDVALVVLPGTEWTYWFDPTRQESRLAELLVDDTLQRAAGRKDSQVTGQREITEKGSRYIDFLIPGLLGMNLMGTGMWGIGFSIVQARSKKLLRRLVATPMRRSHYLLSQMLGRLAFLVLEVSVLLAFARFALQVPLRGSLLALAFVSVLGAFTFAGMGLLVASRAQTIEGIQGLMNAVMMPMWILSGIFFSTSRFPDIMQPLVQALPLTAINDALRAVMLDGASLVQVAGEIGITAVWGVAAFGAALALFRWR